MVRHAFFVCQINTISDICFIAKSCANIHIRRYARILRRNPLRTLTQKEAEDLAKGVSRNETGKLNSKVESAKYQQPDDDQQIRCADNLQIPFTKLHEGDERFGYVTFVEF